MHPSLHKIGVVATTEFNTSVRSKSFIIGLLALPVIMLGSVGLQLFMAKRADTRTRNVAIIDHTGLIYPALEKSAEAYNAKPSSAKTFASHPPIKTSLARTDANAETATTLDLADRVRRAELDAYVIIPPNIFEAPADKPTAAPKPLEYYSENPNDDVIRTWLNPAINNEVRAHRFHAVGIDQAVTDRLNQPVLIENLGLPERDVTASADKPGVKAGEKVDRVRSALVPAALMVIVFFVVMTSAPQLLNTVIEEKMSKISEVLLGSITPFELMMGKLLGNAGIALTLGFLYIAGGYAVAVYYDYANVVSTPMLIALTVSVVLAVLLYGAAFIAVGSACNDLKDAQSLMLPVVLLATFPMMVWMSVLENPSSPMSVGLSLFPPASPYLMLMRMALKPAPPAWQVGLAMLLTTLSAIACIWAAGKIFRTGLLMQGKTPGFRELARWVISK
jgi:ABC-2 type transport system permease protein